MLFTDTQTMTSRTLGISLAVALGAAAISTAQEAAPPSPKLIVILAVDQMRTDYLERYAAHMSGGLARLVKEGAWFTHGAYPYLNTVTCAGHSTIGTGTFPYRHGMILNAWFDRATGTSPTCTVDESATEISYSGLPPLEGDSAKKLLVPSLGELVRKQGGGRVVALSLKPRSAVPLAGHAGDVVAWFDDRGGWTTSSVYGPPSAVLQEFIAANPPAADYDKVWDRSLAPDAYQFADEAAGERPVIGWSRTFPHPLGRPGGSPGTDFYTRWQRSPFSDEYLGRMAEAMVERLELGRRATPDFLAISFSALDMVGHQYGPRSHEVQDLLLRLDATIGRLLKVLDDRVGRQNYVVGLSADHGVAEIPEQSTGSGRLLPATVNTALQKALAAAVGPGPHGVVVNYTDIYLSMEARERLRQDEKARATVVAALAHLNGIARVFHGSEVSTAEARASSDPVLRAAALSYHPGRSGDLVVVPRERWLFSDSATTHGSLYEYDQRVPVLVFGAGVKSGQYTSPATPADIAPTLAALASVPMADTDGRVLREALAASVVK
jgi:predicted AlkP superfamily pyrophosphatase or phosphodiesterase